MNKIWQFPFLEHLKCRRLDLAGVFELRPLKPSEKRLRFVYSINYISPLKIQFCRSIKTTNCALVTWLHSLPQTQHGSPSALRTFLQSLNTYLFAGWSQQRATQRFLFLVTTTDLQNAFHDCHCSDLWSHFFLRRAYLCMCTSCYCNWGMTTLSINSRWMLAMRHFHRFAKAKKQVFCSWNICFLFWLSHQKTTCVSHWRSSKSCRIYQKTWFLRANIWQRLEQTPQTNLTDVIMSRHILYSQRASTAKTPLSRQNFAPLNWRFWDSSSWDAVWKRCPSPFAFA